MRLYEKNSNRNITVTVFSTQIKVYDGILRGYFPVKITYIDSKATSNTQKFQYILYMRIVFTGRKRINKMMSENVRDLKKNADCTYDITNLTLTAL